MSQTIFFKCFWFSKTKTMVSQSTFPLIRMRAHVFKGKLICIFQLLYTSLIKMLNKISRKSEKYFITFFPNFYLGKETVGKVGKSYERKGGFRWKFTLLGSSMSQNYTHVRCAVTICSMNIFENLLKSEGKGGKVQ